MKTSNSFLMLLLLLTPFALSSQSIVGSWVEQITTPDGEQVVSTFSMTEDGIFTVDFTSNGEVDILGTYTLEGSQITVMDTPEESPCHGKNGVYNFKIEDDSITITLVEDACEMRRRDQPWVMTRKR